MNDLENLTEDFPTTPVPEENAVSGLRVAMVIIGFTITLPIFIAGSTIGLTLGLYRATHAFVVGGLILAAIGIFSSYIGSKTRLSTYVITQFCFGRAGARVVNGVIAVALFGWYGVTAELFGRACQRTIVDLYGLDLGTVPLSIVGSALMILTAIWGFKALDKLSIVAVPLMLALLATAVTCALRIVTWDQLATVKGADLPVGAAISMVVGSFIVGAILLPDLCRYARRTWEGMLAAALSLAVVFPAVFYCAMIPSLATGKHDLVLIMIGLGIGLPALILLVFATWSTNSHNLYSTSLTLASLLPGVSKWKLTIAAGTIGTCVAATGMANHFTAFLILLGTTIPGIAGIYAADFLILSDCRYDLARLAERPRWNWSAFTAWLSASTLGLLAERGHVGITGIASCDSILVAFVVYLALVKLRYITRRFGTHAGTVEIKR